MALTTEMVYQALVLSSIFLMAISLPKLVIYTSWSSWRLHVYRNLMTSRVLKEYLSKEIIEKSNDPTWQYEREVRELDSYVRDVKKPLVELLAAIILLPLSAAGLTVESNAVGLIVALEAVIVIVFLITFATFGKRVLRMQKLKGGGPLV